METRLVSLTALVLGLAMGPSASAQTKDKTPGKDSDRNTGKQQQTIRGVIAGVTVEGELAIDYKSNKAMEAEMTYLTIVGHPRGMRMRRDADASARSNDRDDNKGDRDRRGDRGSASRRRMNVYVVWITPRTEFRDAEDRGRRRSDSNKDNDNQGGLTLNDLEVGDRVEVTFNVRDELNTGGAQNQRNEIRRKHGRHRTYFGDATSIVLLSEPRRDRDQCRDQDRDRDRHQDNDEDNHEE